MNWIWVNLKTFAQKFISKRSFTQLENHSYLLCGRDFEDEITVALSI